MKNVYSEKETRVEAPERRGALLKAPPPRGGSKDLQEMQRQAQDHAVAAESSNTAAAGKNTKKTVP